MIAESGSPSGSEARPYYDFLETCLRHKAEMVIFEAARAICEMRDVSNRYALASALRPRAVQHSAPAAGNMSSLLIYSMDGSTQQIDPICAFAR